MSLKAQAIDIEFKQFKELEDYFEIESNLQQRALLYQIKLLKVLGYPIPYKEL